jgi:hypothetical protein
MNGEEPGTLENVWRPLHAFRITQWATLAALSLKIGAFYQMFRCYLTTPLRQDFFPSVFESAYVLLVAYLTTVVMLILAATTASSRRRLVASMVALSMVTVLCIHQGSHNDMTFATAWWTSLWSVWLASRLPIDEPRRLIRRAAFLARCMISMILLGGAVGKWTSEYWSGQVLYEIYFLHRDFWLFNLLRQNLNSDSLRDAAMWYSQMVIAIETLCGLGLWLLPARWAAGVAILVMSSIAIFSNFYLFSVLFSLIGLAASGFFVCKGAHTEVAVADAGMAAEEGLGNQ